MRKTKPYGIFEIVNNQVTKHSVIKSLEKLLDIAKSGRQGHEAGIWTFDEVLNMVECYVILMYDELNKELMENENIKLFSS